jgi:Na+/H+ antiporter NhaC
MHFPRCHPALLIGAVLLGGALLAVATPATTAPAAPPATGPAATTPAAIFGPWVLLPPLVAIILAIVWRQVIPALAVGTLVGATMVGWAGGDHAVGPLLLAGLRLAVETYLIGAIADADHIKIIVFTLTIGGMVGIIAENGGTGAIVRAVAGWARDRRRGQLATWLAGLLVFFDDYANAMIVGPAMRPICDRLRISRAKLAYLVDSTAAPVASIAIIGTWIGAEIDYIQIGLDGLDARPAFLAEVNGYGAFLASIPYRFYPLLALFMVLAIGLLNRDFGPMRAAESAVAGNTHTDDVPRDDNAPIGRAWYAAVPILILVCFTLGLLVLTGYRSVAAADGPMPGGLELVQQIISNGDSYNAILYGALAAIVAAIIISLVTRRLTIARTMDSATDSMARMFPTMLVLVLAWTLAATISDLELGVVAREMLRAASFDVAWLPLAIFVTASIVSFATGTSWGTMGILCPAVVTIAAGLLADVPAAEAAPLFYASVGAVLAGAVFGDHCSPISDTTVLSSLASDCTLEQHVWTQMPYALVVGVVSILAGDVLCRQTDIPWWGGLGIGAAALVLILLIFGGSPRRAAAPSAPPAA